MMTDFIVSYSNFFIIVAVLTIILLLITFVIALINIIRTKKLNKEISSLFAGKKGIDLEEILLNNNKKMKEFDKEIQELFDISNSINKQAHKDLHKVGLIKFNPFGERAGNQSFALALLNSADDGLILSSLHTREGTRMYTKQISKGKPVNNELTNEEKEAIETAQ